MFFKNRYDGHKKIIKKKEEIIKKKIVFLLFVN